ncbi:hypothetical protein LFYK43_09840 [Ligilactobacillus salitolerans]|uniref:Plasmid pRiA4b Orf3-like domain-containing protein n=1 Tax=Ligilactobacillus salitolerans TaxID=1808352 RepID=A0A401ISQ5_9LACO|nr:plasmid pRiA4b ORF-3 family protein [Ligilactobacillus salitolerans]GBG94525.1 hypothetical protein LFYK43_09840 [Ligilactobacillus salitolerans]
MAKEKVYRFRADLKGAKPPVWRRFEVSGEQTLKQLAAQLMAIFEMEGKHMYSLTELVGDQFRREYRQRQKADPSLPELGPFDERIKNIGYDLGVDDPEDTLHWSQNLVKPGTTKLSETFAQVGSKFRFEYDFTADWEVSLKVEKVAKIEVDHEDLPRVLKGKGAGILEGLGDLEGLLDFDDDLDEDEFDLEAANVMIKEAGGF